MHVQYLINFYLRLTGAYEIRIDNLHNRLNFDLGKKNKSFHHSLKGISKLIKLQSLVAKCDKKDRRYSPMQSLICIYLHYAWKKLRRKWLLFRA